MKDEKYSKTFTKVFEDRIFKIKKIFELYTDDNKSKYFSSPKNIFNSAKNKYAKLYTKGDNFQTCYY